MRSRWRDGILRNNIALADCDAFDLCACRLSGANPTRSRIHNNDNKQARQAAYRGGAGRVGAAAVAVLAKEVARCSMTMLQQVHMEKQLIRSRWSCTWITTRNKKGAARRGRALRSTRAPPPPATRATTHKHAGSTAGHTATVPSVLKLGSVPVLSGRGHAGRGG